MESVDYLWLQLSEHARAPPPDIIQSSFERAFSALSVFSVRSTATLSSDPAHSSAVDANNNRRDKLAALIIDVRSVSLCQSRWFRGSLGRFRGRA